jgi:hypothetical protein
MEAPFFFFLLLLVSSSPSTARLSAYGVNTEGQLAIVSAPILAFGLV